MKFAALLLACAAACPAFAQPAALPPGNTQPHLPAPVAAPAPTVVLAPSPATEQFNTAMTAMMQGMSKPYTGDTDRDFVVHMLPHHQGAIEMAEIELKYGHDPKLKLLASRIISAQQREIAFMQVWLEKQTEGAKK